MAGYRNLPDYRSASFRNARDARYSARRRTQAGVGVAAGAAALAVLAVIALSFGHGPTQNASNDFSLATAPRAVNPAFPGLVSPPQPGNTQAPQQ